MRYTATVKISRASELKGLHAGQWISMDGARGRFMGIGDGGSVWVAWGSTATKRFAKFASAYKKNAN